MHKRDPTGCLTGKVFRGAGKFFTFAKNKVPEKIEKIATAVTEASEPVAVTAEDIPLKSSFIEKAEHSFSNWMEKASERAHQTSKTVAKKEINEPFKFTKTAGRHMEEVSRMIPVQILKDIIKAPIAVAKDPQGTNALMHYSRMWKNGKLYNVEVWYEKTTNQIRHFLYRKDALDPLPKIR